MTVNFWHGFLRQCKTIKKCVETFTYDGTRAVMKILMAVIGGESNPDVLWRQAVPLPCVPIPKNCYRILIEWSEKLPKDSLLLGQVYEKLALGRKAQGLYYTPLPVIEFILANTVDRCDIVLQPMVRILDPACGSGYFLLKAYDILWQKYRDARPRLKQAYPQADWSDDGIHRHIIKYNLWGADIDPQAAEIAAMSLLLKRPAANHGLTANIVCCDSLRGAEKTNSIHIKEFWAKPFQYVIGNPPYLSFGLRGAQALAPDYREYLRKTYPAAAEYKLSYYALFLQRGIDLLDQAGRLGFILPDSFLQGRYYSKIRRYILSNTAIETLVHITAPVFKRASLGFCAVCILQKQPAAIRQQNLVNIYTVDQPQALHAAQPCCRYEQSYFTQLPHSRFRLYQSLTQKKVIDKIDSISVPLGKFATGHTGIRSVTRQQDIIARTPQGDGWQRGLVSGSQLYRYGVTYDGHWLNINPAVLYKGGWQPAIVSQKKILVRQTGYNLVAAIDDNGYYHLNNIHAFVSNDAAVSLEYILMLLNSRLLAFYYHTVSLEYGRAMAQTDIESLELLPVCWNAKADKLARRLVGLMAKYMRQAREGNCLAAQKVNTLDAYFNRLVYQVYGLTAEEINYIEDFEEALSLRKNAINHQEKGL